MKLCTKCGQEKPRDRFSPNSQSKDPEALRSWCKDCVNAAARANDRKRKESDPLKYAYKAFIKDSGRNCRSKNWNHHTKCTATIEEYAVHWHKDNCDCCGVSFDSGKRTKKCIDHCHDTGKIRGALCFACNTLEGQIGGIEGATRLLNYLTKDQA